jgi:hypothetical protein
MLGEKSEGRRERLGFSESDFASLWSWRTATPSGRRTSPRSPHGIPTVRPKPQTAKPPEPSRFRGLNLVAGGRYARVCLPVPLMLPVVGRVAAAATAG